MISKKDIAFEGRDWKGRTLTLLKSTIKNHVALFHIDELFVVGRLRENLHNPLQVTWNPGAKSEQAIYDIQVGGHRYLQVNIKTRGLLKKTLIVTFYGVDALPKGKIIWTR